MNSIFKQFKYRLFYPSATWISKKLRLRPFELHAGEKHVFLVTAGRSGSTLLASLLSNHHQIHFPPEQSVLWFQINRFYGFPFETWDSYCKSVLDRFTRIHENWGFTNSDYQIIANELASLPLTNRNISNLVRVFYNHHARSFDKGSAQILGDMTPISANLFRTVYPEFPEAKYIFLVRNPLDVVASYLRNPELGYANLNKAVWRWKNSVEAFRCLKDKDRNVLLVRYEDLASGANSELHRIAEFLNIEWIDEYTSNPKNLKALGAEGKSFHSNLRKPINTSQISAWTHDLNKKEAEKIRLQLRTQMSLFGYD